MNENPPNLSDYPRPSLTADIVAYSPQGGGVYRVLFIERKKEPFKKHLALPGGFLDPNETLEEAASRELLEETNLKAPANSMELLTVQSKPGRDPRGWVVSSVFTVELTDEELKAARAGDDASKAYTLYISLKSLKEQENILAFDHAEVIKKFLETVK